MKLAAWTEFRMGRHFKLQRMGRKGTGFGKQY